MGREGRAPRGPNSFNSTQFLGNFGKIVCWRPSPRIGAPPQGNPGSATGMPLPVWSHVLSRMSLPVWSHVLSKMSLPVWSHVPSGGSGPSGGGSGPSGGGSGPSGGGSGPGEGMALPTLVNTLPSRNFICEW